MLTTAFHMHQENGPGECIGTKEKGAHRTTHTVGGKMSSREAGVVGGSVDEVGGCIVLEPTDGVLPLSFSCSGIVRNSPREISVLMYASWENTSCRINSLKR